MSVPNTPPTAAVTGTDLTGFAALDAVSQLNERLLPFRKANQEIHPNKESQWRAIIKEAFLARVNLAVTGHGTFEKVGFFEVVNISVCTLQFPFKTRRLFCVPHLGSIP